MPTTVTVHPPRSFIDRYFFFQADDNWRTTALKIVNCILILPTFGLNILLLAFYDVWRWDVYTDIDLPPRLPFGLFANLFPRRSHLSGNPIVPIHVTGHYRAPQFVVSPPPYVRPFGYGSPPPSAPPTPFGQRPVVGGAAGNPDASRGGLSAQPVGIGLTATPRGAFPPPPPYPPQVPHMSGSPGAPLYRHVAGQR